MRTPVVLFLLCTGVAVYLLMGKRRESADRSPRTAWKNPGETNLNRVLATQLARKMGFVEDQTLEVLEGGGNNELRRRIDDVLQDVTVTFSRRSAAEAHQASLRIGYTDGSVVTVEYLAPWDQLPDGVRAEVLRTGKPECVRSWVAPWHNADGLI